MPKVITLKATGEKITIYNPAEKSKKYAADLKYGVDTNSGKKLTTSKKAWRSGYLAARKDNAKAYNAKKKSKAYYDRKKSLIDVFK